MSAIRQAGTGRIFIYLSFVQQFDGYTDRRSEFAHDGWIWRCELPSADAEMMTTIPVSGGLAVLTESPEVSIAKGKMRCG
jgi:hypothetical protein